MGQIQLTIALVLIALFSIAIIGFAMHFAVDNHAAVSVSDDPEISGLYSSTSEDVGQFGTDSESQYQSIIETTLQSGADSPQSVGAFSVTPMNAIGVSKNIMQVGYTKIFGTGSGFGIFLTALISVIVFMVGLFLYKTLKGLPD